MRRLLKVISVVLLFSLIINVNADIKCDDGKPGDTVNCTIKNAGAIGSIKRIAVDSGLSFVSCDVCDDTQYTIEADKESIFKFKISDDIKETKKLRVSFGGESSSINVIVDETDEESDETVYSVTLVPGNNKSNKTLTCTINSLNSTCNVTLEVLEDENFTGWGQQKGCTEGATGGIKVNKNITYYACYKKEETGTDLDELNRNLLLKSLIVKNGEEEIDLGFSIRIFDYSVVIPTTVNSLNIEALAQDDDVEVVVSGHEKIENEENIITIALTSEDGSKNEYVLNVVKRDEIESPLLSSLVVGGYNIGFTPGKFSYNLTIDDGISSLSIDAIPEKEDYEYKVTGNAGLKDGSQINIVVINPDTNAESTYVINIEQATSKLLIYIAIGGIVLVILIILLIIVVKKGKNANKKASSSTDVKKNLTTGNANAVNVKTNIPEVKPTIPTAPKQPIEPINQPNNVKEAEEKKEDIEVLDF